MRKIFSLLAGLLLLSAQLLAQTRTITGRVTDANNNPVVNASVVVKGTKVGTTTKVDGTFSLTVSTSAKTLTVSSVEFSEQDVAIGDRSAINVTLTTKSESLSEVIVSVPYGSIKKTSFTGSEATVTSRVIERQQVTSVTKVLEGSVPGLIATNGGGAPGSSADIRIRGFGSINGSSTPLYVLNGVPYDGSISALSNDEIESVTVLKDASAAALYGSRAANGVIMITTKKGKRGKSAVSANVRQGFMSRGIPEYSRLNQKDYYELNWESIRNSFVASGDSYATAGQKASQQLTDGSHLVYNAYNVAGTSLVDPTTGKLDPNAKLLWTDSWEDALFRTASRTNANVNISGGGDKNDYFLSLGYLNEQGTMKNTGYKRYNFRLNVNSAATSWLNAGLNVDGAMTDNKNVINGGTATSNPFYYTRQMGPIYPVYQYDGSGNVVLDSLGQKVLDWGVPTQMGTRPYAGNSNLLGSLALDDRSSKLINANANTFVEVKFLKDFSFKTTLGVNIWDNQSTAYQNNQYGDAANVRGRSTKTSERQTSLTFNEVLSWNKTFGEHSVKALVGHENYRLQYNNLNLTRTGFQFPGQTELDNATITESVGGSYEDNHRIESYFAGVNYEFDQKYLVSGSFRRDGSSRFADSVRWGNFYSAGLGWRISQESFMNHIKWLNELKLKASYGEQGNENIGLYYQYRDYYYADGSGGYSTPARPANPGLKWESNKTLNVGFDFAILDNRLQGTIEYFNKVSNNLLFDVPVPTSTGNASYWGNAGALKNYGIELQLGYNAIRKRDFDWRIDLALTHFKNKVTRLPPTQRERGIITGTKRLLEGRSIYDFWVREYAGVDASTGEALYYADVLGTDGKPTGDRVLTNDITKASYYYKGTAVPDISGGITNSFHYKNFDLSFLVTFSYGGLFYDGNYAGLMHSGSYGIAWSSDILQRWQKPGDVTNVPKVQNSRISVQDGQSSRFLMDASYVNFKNITLSYTLPASILHNIGNAVSSIQIFGNVDNAYLFTAKKGMDPQRSFGGTSDATYPPFRTITFGLNVKL
ncbi:MAG: TonB-dependent receptor [Chitinophagaceae bacterium]